MCYDPPPPRTAAAAACLLRCRLHCAGCMPAPLNRDRQPSHPSTSCCVGGQVEYFYRLNDFPDGSLEPGSSNARMFCKALVTLGIVDGMQAAEDLMSKKGTTTRAGRLLNRFVSAARLVTMLHPTHAQHRRLLKHDCTHLGCWAVLLKLPGLLLAVGRMVDSLSMSASTCAVLLVPRPAACVAALLTQPSFDSRNQYCM